jgi:ADP-heptose:LPS heptosyltransferase
MKTLVIRLSSLGDVVLAGQVTANLSPVTFLTSRRYVEVAQALQGVTEVLAWEDHPDIHGAGFERVVDLHASPRSRWLSRGMAVQRVKRFDVQRRLRVALKRAPAPSVSQRYSTAAGVPAQPAPWMESHGHRDALLVVPGTAHATKQWAPESYAEICQRWAKAGGKVWVIGSAGESDLCREVAGHSGEVLAEAGFSETMRLVRTGRAALGGDTGLMHLAHASGTPTLTLFGPTTKDDGFWPHGQGVSIPLSCRPCSRHGGAVCPIGDLSCMRDLSIDSVWETLTHMVQP